jgi:hypothetical protein
MLPKTLDRVWVSHVETPSPQSTQDTARQLHLVSCDCTRTYPATYPGIYGTGPCQFRNSHTCQPLSPLLAAMAASKLHDRR